MMLRNLVALIRGVAGFDMCMPMPLGSRAKDRTGMCSKLTPKVAPEDLFCTFCSHIRINETNEVMN